MNDNEIMQYAYDAAVAKYDIPVIEAVGERLKIDYVKDLPLKVKLSGIRKAIKTGDAKMYAKYKFKDFEKHLDITKLTIDAFRSKLGVWILDEFKSLGADIDKVKDTGLTSAIRNSHPEKFLWFLGHGADTNNVKRENLNEELDGIFIRFTGLTKVEKKNKTFKNVTRNNESALEFINSEFKPGDVTLSVLEENGYVIKLDSNVLETLISNDFTAAVIEYCFNQPKDVSIKAIQRSIYHGNINIVEELLTRNTLSKKEYTKLVSYAVRYGYSYILQYLLLNIDLVDKKAIGELKKFSCTDNITLYHQYIHDVFDSENYYPIMIENIYNPQYILEDNSITDYQFDENGEFVIDDDIDNIELMSNNYDVLEVSLQNEKSDIISETLSELNEREQAVIRLRYGLYSDYEEHDTTLEYVGKTLNVTRERVRQIESSAFKKLKHPKVAKDLKKYLDLDTNKDDKYSRQNNFPAPKVFDTTGEYGSFEEAIACLTRKTLSELGLLHKVKDEVLKKLFKLSKRETSPVYNYSAIEIDTEANNIRDWVWKTKSFMSSEAIYIFTQIFDYKYDSSNVIRFSTLSSDAIELSLHGRRFILLHKQATIF